VTEYLKDRMIDYMGDWLSHWRPAFVIRLASVGYRDYSTAR